MTELRLGLLGSGYMGRTYAECITKYNTRGRLIAISGGTRAPGLAADYDVAYEPSYEALLERPDIDAVLIATPHGMHRGQVIQAAQHRKNVLVEKPMATCVADCDAMIAACDEAGVVLEVVKTMRFRGVVVRAKHMINDGKLGRVRMLRGQSLSVEYGSGEDRWATRPEHGGAFLDMGVHNFDLFRFLTGSEARLVFGHVTTYGHRSWPGLSFMTQIVFADFPFTGSG